MAKRRKGKQSRVEEAVTEAETILRKLIDDSHVREAVAGLLDAVGISEGEEEEQPAVKRKRGFGIGKLAAVAGLVGGGALAASSGLRNKVLDMLFGAEEEFQYTPPTPDSTDGQGTEGEASESQATEAQATEGESTDGAATDGDGSGTPSAA